VRDTFASLWSRTLALLLDFDGLLVDSEPFHYRAYARVFLEFGHRVDPEEYWREFTNRGAGSRGEIERYGLEIDPEEVDRRKRRLYSTFCREGRIRWRRGAPALLEEARTSGRPWIVASASREEDIRAILSRLDPPPRMPEIVGRAAVRRPKPDPDVFLAAARRLGVEPPSCLVMEDAQKGVRAARRAGMPCVVARTPENRGLLFEEADLVVGGVEELAGLVREARGGE
jgi:HAD superfamily hydrolase (TIGR01509 family)